MKRLILSFFVMSCALTVTPRADANIINVSDNDTTPGQAAALVTQPVMISSAGEPINQANRLKEVANSIGALHSQPASLQQFFQQNQNQTPQQIDPLGVTKVTPLDSENLGSISLPVAHF